MTKYKATDEVLPAYLQTDSGRLAIRHQSAGAGSGDEAGETSETGETGDAPHILFCSGFHSTMLGNKAGFLSQMCREHQWAFTRFDYRGHGESDGAPQDFTLAHWLQDTLDVIDSSTGPVLLVGSSMGAWLATLAALRRPDRIVGLLLLAAAPDFLDELIVPRLDAAQIWDLQQDSTVNLAGEHEQPYPITQALIDSARSLSVLNTPGSSGNPPVSELACPVRLIHGTHDMDVPSELSSRLMAQIVHDDARLTLLHRADHRLSDERSLQFLSTQLRELVTHVSERQQA
ncbi:MAG: alpha/beta hydrolase [Granulosicoccus sp.]|nr:alpha/beta hydrolase [Granulosicoccus sp.]